MRALFHFMLSIRSLLAGMIVMLGATVMSGWFLRAPAMVQVSPGLQAMTFGSALCFLLTGVALLASQVAPLHARRLQSACGYIVFILASMMLAEQLSGADLGVGLPALHAWLDSADPHPGRIPVNSALAFILSGATLVMIHRVRGTFGMVLIGTLIFSIISIGIIGLVGYSLGVKFIYSWHGYSSMAVQTAAGISVVGVLMLLSWRELPWYRARVEARPDEYIAAVAAAWLTVVALAAGVTGFVVMWQRAEQSLGDTLSVALRHRAQLFESLIGVRIDSTTFVVTRPQLARQTRVLMHKPADTQARELLAGVADSFVASGFSAVAFYDREGRETARSGEFIGAPELRMPMKTRYESELLWKNRLVLRVRAAFTDGPETLGTVVTEHPLPILARALTEISGLGETGDSGLCGMRDGLLNCFPHRLHQRVSSMPDNLSGKPLPVTRAIAGESGTARSVDYRGKNVIVAYAPVGTLGLGMSLKMDVAEIYAPAGERLQGLVPLLLGLIIAGALALRFLIKPLVAELLRSREALRIEVTARSKAEEELRRTNTDLANAMRAKDHFLTSMSHELRTPLNAIIGFTGTLLMRLPGPLTQDQEKQLKTVQTSARHQLSLINDLLDIARMESGKVELKLEDVACRGVAEEVLASLRPLADEKGLELMADLPEAALMARADRRAMIQILLNLTNNAIKFTEQGKVLLSVGTRRQHGAALIEFNITDTGVGIRPEDQGRLFGAFEQAGINTRKRSEGSGLGLHLSAKLAGLLGGEINFRSEYGSGSTFTLILREA